MNQSDTSKPKLYTVTVLKDGLEHGGNPAAKGEQIEVDAPTAIFLADEKRGYIELPTGLKTAAKAAAAVDAS